MTYTIEVEYIRLDGSKHVETLENQVFFEGKRAVMRVERHTKSFVVRVIPLA